MTRAGRTTKRRKRQPRQQDPGRYTAWWRERLAEPVDLDTLHGARWSP